MTKETSNTPAAGTGPVIVDVTLDEPITRGDDTIATVRLRKPRSGELRGLSMVDLVRLEVTTLRDLLPRISDPVLTKEDVDQLQPNDLFQLSSEVAAFLLPKEMNPDSLAR